MSDRFLANRSERKEHVEVFRRTHRQFLNNEDSSLPAIILSSVEVDNWDAVPEKLASGEFYPRDIEASLLISDCRKTISLDFSLYGGDESDVEEILSKVSRLYVGIASFKADMEAAVNKYLELRKYHLETHPPEAEASEEQE